MLSILPRQEFSNSQTLSDDEIDDVPFWWTQKGQIVRWAIFLGLLLLIFSFLAFSLLHAKRRMARGLPPLPYHRWMVKRHQVGGYDQNYQNQASYYGPYTAGNQYHMHPMPPPVYDPNAAMPPVYQPPEGASKVAPSQYTSGPTRRPVSEDPSPSYEPPQGPPPRAGV